MAEAEQGSASEAARELANARWRGQVVSRAIATLASRSNELTGEQLADLRVIAEGPAPGEGSPGDS